MVIQAHGNTCVSIQAEEGNDVSTVVMDPYEGEGANRLPRALAADLVFCSRQTPEHGYVAGVGGTPFVVSMPGEFEVKGLMLDARTVPLEKDSAHLIARLYAEGMTVAFLGGLTRELTEAELELVEGADILIVPVSGGEVLSAKTAAVLAQSVEPRIIVPLGDAGAIASFKKEFGPVRTEESAKIKIQKKLLPTDDVLLAVMSE